MGLNFKEKQLPKVLFILKRRSDYNAIEHSNIKLSTGLYNSAEYMNTMLNESGIESHIVVVVDNNCIDREVTKYNPTHVVIEALWVVPDKFEVLHKLHPKVNWIIRLHSEIPFIANEGMAIDWLFKYNELRKKCKLVYSGSSAIFENSNLNPYVFTKSKNIELILF